MLPIYINGRFLDKPISGVQRFAHEIVRALDVELAKAENASLRVELLAPPLTTPPEGLKCIEFRTCGSHGGHLWEQWDLWHASRGGALLSLANSGPILHSNQLVVLHDVLPFRVPENYTFAYRTFHKTLGRLMALRCQLATVSEFSRREIAEVLGVDPTKIAVISNGHEHILHISPDDSVLTKLGLMERPFFLFVGSPSPSKNLERAFKAFVALNRPEITFVIVGGKAKIFSGNMGELPNNVLIPGRLTDNEIVSLYKSAVALIFPSRYEGFGIPPLEAMALGCPVLASRIPPVEDVCGDAAIYFDPLDPASMAMGMQEILNKPDLRDELSRRGIGRFPNFSWQDNAIRFVNKLHTDRGCMR